MIAQLDHLILSVFAWVLSGTACGLILLAVLWKLAHRRTDHLLGRTDIAAMFAHQQALDQIAKGKATVVGYSKEATR